MVKINKPSQPLIPPTDVEEVEEIAANAAETAIAADDTHAPLVDDKVPAEHLPSYVDDVLNFASAEEFPEEGEEGKIYVANDTNLTYRWSGAAYIQVGGASLAPGDGIDIENDIVSIDMDYVDENLDHITEAELAAGLAEKQDAGDYATSAELTSGLAAKQDYISDLDAIRSGAAAGATAQVATDNLTNNGDITVYYIENHSYSDLTNADKETLISVRQAFVAGKHPKLYCIRSENLSLGLTGLSVECILKYYDATLDVYIPFPNIVSGYTTSMRYYYLRVRNNTVSDGNPTMCQMVGKYANSQVSQFEWDDIPVQNSTKAVISGGVYTALQAKANASDTYTKSEVDSAISAAIGNVLNEEF